MERNETGLEMNLANCRTAVEEKIAAFNAALRTNDNTAITHAEEDLKSAEKEYANQKALVVYAELMKADNPMLAAMTMHSYITIGHKAEKSNGVISRVELTEDRERQIDLYKFCTREGLPTRWAHDIEHLNHLFAVKNAYELGVSEAQKEEIIRDFNMSEYVKRAVKKKEAGGTPFSNTALTSMLNGILADTVGEGYKCNSHDIAYIDKLYGKKSNKSKLTIVIGNESFFRLLICDVIHRVVTGAKYNQDHSKLVKKKGSVSIATTVTTSKDGKSDEKPAAKATKKTATAA